MRATEKRLNWGAILEERCWERVDSVMTDTNGFNDADDGRPACKKRNKKDNNSVAMRSLQGGFLAKRDFFFSIRDCTGPACRGRNKWWEREKEERERRPESERKRRKKTAGTLKILESITCISHSAHPMRTGQNQVKNPIADPTGMGWSRARVVCQKTMVSDVPKRRSFCREERILKQPACR